MKEFHSIHWHPEQVMAKGPGFLTFAELVFLIMAILSEMFMIYHRFSIEDFEIIYILGLFCTKIMGKIRYTNATPWRNRTLECSLVWAACVSGWAYPGGQGP